MRHRSLPTLLIACAFSWIMQPSSAVAQFSRGGGGPSPERMIGFIDSNNDGTIDTEEMQRMFPPFREALQNAGVDTSRPISREDFLELAPKMMEGMRNSRGFGGRGGEDRGSGDRRGSRRDRSRVDGNDSSSHGRDSSTPKTPAPRPRVTLDLPAAFTARDINGDRQIGLYEWDRASLAEFLRLDRNGDGFLTPAELTYNPAAKGITPTAPIAVGPLANATTAAPTASAPAIAARGGSSGVSPTPTPSPATDSDDRASLFAYRSLDRDRDGSLTETEWKRSRSTRGRFERAGIQPTFPMTMDQFKQLYAQLPSSDGNR